jgi:ATP-binding cassette subfamily B protein
MKIANFRNSRNNALRDQKTIYKYRRLLRYALKEWRSLIIIGLFTLITPAITALQPWPIKILIDYALGDHTLPNSIQNLINHFSIGEINKFLIVVAAIFSFALFALNSFIDMVITFAWSSAGQRMVYKLSADLFHHLQRLSLAFHSRQRIGDLINRISDDTYCVYKASQVLLISPIRNLLTLILITTVAWELDQNLTLVLLALSPLMAISALYFGPRLKRQARQKRENQSFIMNLLHQTISSIPLVKAHSAEARNSQRFETLTRDAAAISQQESLLENSYNVVNGLTTTAGIAIIIFLGGQKVLSGAISVGTLIVFISYMHSLEGVLKAILETYGSVKPIEVSIDRVSELLIEENTVTDNPRAISLPIHKDSMRGRHIRLEDITFGYKLKESVLKNICLEALPGEKLAIVGKSGAGKSTLVSLILRYYDPWNGRVTFDGIDIRNIKLSSLRSQIAIVLQEPFLFPVTVLENISYGRPDASREEIIRAAKLAHAHEFILNLTNGYDTMIGDKGATLSGGQKQRIALARAFLKDAPILILDEPTSAIDDQTESPILEAIDELSNARTTIMIAHRLSTVRSANRIIVLENGQVAESGSHNELILVGGIYQQFYSVQYDLAKGELT